MVSITGRTDARAQAHTLEAFVAALLLISGLLFAVQATAVTPLSASTSNQHIENQQRAMAEDLLATADERGDLEEAVLYWNASAGRFKGTGDLGYYTEGGPSNLAFGRSLNDAFRSQRIAFNVRVAYHNESAPSDPTEGTIRTRRLVYMGTPSDNAVRASRTVAVSNRTRLTDPDFDSTTLEDVQADPSLTFYASNVDDGQLFNLLEVRIVVWRM